MSFCQTDWTFLNLMSEPRSDSVAPTEVADYGVDQVPEPRKRRAEDHDDDDATATVKQAKTEGAVDPAKCQAKDDKAVPSVTGDNERKEEELKEEEGKADDEDGSDDDSSQEEEEDEPSDSSASDEEEDKDDSDSDDDACGHCDGCRQLESRERDLAEEADQKLVCQHAAQELYNEPYQHAPDDAQEAFQVLKGQQPCPPLPVAELPFCQLEYIEDLIYRAYTLQLVQVAVPDRVNPRVVQALKDAGFKLFRTTFCSTHDEKTRDELNITYTENWTHQDAVNFHPAEWWRRCMDDWTLAYHVVTEDL